MQLYQSGLDQELLAIAFVCMDWRHMREIVADL
jgi:hypothetical protein